MFIRKLNLDEEPPMDLLLLADPSKVIVEEYLQRGECFVAESGTRIIGVYVLLPTRSETVVFCKEKVQKNARENTQACQPSNSYLFLTRKCVCNSKTIPCKIQNMGMMDNSIHKCSGQSRITKHTIPLAKF